MGEVSYQNKIELENYHSLNIEIACKNEKEHSYNCYHKNIFGILNDKAWKASLMV